MLTHLVTFLLMTVAVSCLRRRVELDVCGWEARQSLRAWSVSKLNRVMGSALVAVALLIGWEGAAAPGFYAAVGGTAIVLIGGAYMSRHIRRCLRWVWTH